MVFKEHSLYYVQGIMIILVFIWFAEVVLNNINFCCKLDDEEKQNCDNFWDKIDLEKLLKYRERAEKELEGV